MATSNISPQGYVYGGDPRSSHPFWEEQPAPVSQYLRDVTAVLAETAEGKTWTFYKEDNEEIVSQFAELFIPAGGGGETPGEVLTGVRLTPTQTSTGTRYYITTIAYDESETGIGYIDVPQQPSEYLKSITHAGGQNLDTYTITDADGTQVTISTPTYYLEKITGSVDPQTGTAAITQTGYVNGQEVTQNVISMTLEKTGNTHTLTVQSNGETMSDTWTEGGGGGGGATPLTLKTFEIGEYNFTDGPHLIAAPVGSTTAQTVTLTNVGQLRLYIPTVPDTIGERVLGFCGTSQLILYTNFSYSPVISTDAQRFIILQGYCYVTRVDSTRAIAACYLFGNVKPQTYINSPYTLIQPYSVYVTWTI